METLGHVEAISKDKIKQCLLKHTSKIQTEDLKSEKWVLTEIRKRVCSYFSLARAQIICRLNWRHVKFQTLHSQFVFEVMRDEM